MIRVLGIDPGYDRLGIAVCDAQGGKTNIIYSDCFISDKKESYDFRLSSLGKKVGEIVKKFRPDIMAIENVYFANNQKTASRVAEIRGMLIYIAAESKMAIENYTPLEIKLAVTGYGRADKKQVIDMVGKLTGKTRTYAKNGFDDEFDAIAVALTSSARLAITYPQKNQSLFAKHY